MARILNKIAWLASLALGYAIVSMLESEILHTRGFGFFMELIFSGIFGAMVKGAFISESSILEALRAPKAGHTPVKKEVKTLAEEVTHEPRYVREEREEREEMPSHAPALENQPARKFSRVEPEHERTEPEAPGFLSRFFAENALAKIGGMLLFLGVLFLLHLVYTKIGPVGKLTIGFAIGFTVYGVGLWLEKKNLHQESRILLGTAILINYLVILAGRFLIGDALTNVTILSEGVAFVFLIFNTLLAVVTSLVYNSNVLLFFSFIVAYLNPLLVNAEPTGRPYIVVGYAVIISAGALLLSRFLRKKEIPYTHALSHVALAGGNFLFLIAPYTTPEHWLLKLGATVVLTLLATWTVYKNDQKEYLGAYFAAAYLAVVLSIGLGNAHFSDAFTGLSFFIGTMTSLTALMGAGIVVFVTVSSLTVLYLAVTPLVIILGLLLTKTLIMPFMIPVLIAATIAYLTVFIGLFARLDTALRYLFFGVIGLFIILFNGLILSTLNGVAMTFTQGIGVMTATFLFLLAAVWFSSKKDLGYLYTMACVASPIMLLPVIAREGDLMTASIVSVVLYMIINLATPLLNRALPRENLFNLISGLVIGALFGTGELYFFGEKYLQGFTLGLCFLALSIVYAIMGNLMHGRLEEGLRSSDKERQIMARNALYATIGLAVSLFSLAVAFLFSSHPEVIASVWLFEATVLFWFYGQSREDKVYGAAIILMAIGLCKLTALVWIIQEGDTRMLVPFAIIFASLSANFEFLGAGHEKAKPEEWHLTHDFGHLIGAGLVGLFLVKILPTPERGWSMLALSAYSVLLAGLYARHEKTLMKYAYVVWVTLLCLFQLMTLDSLFTILTLESLETLKWLQYGSTALLALAAGVFFRQTGPQPKLTLKIVLALYLFTITTQYVYYLFDHNKFVVTIYWALLAFSYTGAGIAKDWIKCRTFGLYVLSLTVLKILLYDIWIGLQDSTLRILALMITGALMITLSVLYTKKYGHDLKGEFSPENLFQ